MTQTYYTIEVNVARKSETPVWHPLLDDDEDTITFGDLSEARRVLGEEARGDNARIVSWPNGPEFPSVPVD